MDHSKVKALTQEILAFPDAERQQLAEEVLPGYSFPRAEAQRFHPIT